MGFGRRSARASSPCSSDALPQPCCAWSRASTLEAAVALYHLVLEGVVFTAGQLALLELLEDRSLPGLRRGLELVLRDERWHIGFGTSMLSAAWKGVPRDALDAAYDAVEVWGEAVPRRFVTT